jgi:hypothetical protein
MAELLRGRLGACGVGMSSASQATLPRGRPPGPARDDWGANLARHGVSSQVAGPLRSLIKACEVDPGGCRSRPRGLPKSTRGLPESTRGGLSKSTPAVAGVDLGGCRSRPPGGGAARCRRAATSTLQSLVRPHRWPAMCDDTTTSVKWANGASDRLRRPHRARHRPTHRHLHGRARVAGCVQTQATQSSRHPSTHLLTLTAAG